MAACMLCYHHDIQKASKRKKAFMLSGTNMKSSCHMINDKPDEKCMNIIGISIIVMLEL